MPQPDTQSFSRLLVTLGLFLCVVAVVGPVLVLRDTGVLEITAKDLKELTPVAKAELERRQRTAATAGDAAPWVAGLTFVFGLVALGFGIPRLLKQETVSDTRTALELNALQRELQPLTSSERRESVERSIETEDTGAPEATPTTEAVPTPRPEAGRVVRLDRVVRLSDRVTTRLAELADRDFLLSPNVVLKGAAPYTELDAVLASVDGRHRDLVVEIKVPRTVGISALLDYLGKTFQLASNYERQTGRPTRGWLIIVVDDAELSDEVEGIVERYTLKNTSRKSGPAISFVNTEQLSSLVLPSDLAL